LGSSKIKKEPTNKYITSTTFHILDILQKESIHFKHKRQQDNKTQNSRKQIIKIMIILQIITIPTFNLSIQVDHFKATFHILNTLPTYKYIHFKITFMCPRSIAGVLSSQALPGYLITAHPSFAFLM